MKHLARHGLHDGAFRAMEEAAFYKPYGEKTPRVLNLATTPENKGWIGQRYDAGAGLQYLNARYYDPELGMFLQPDWFEVTRPGVGTNRFAYGLGDPVNLSDPGGHEVISKAFSDKEKGLLGKFYDSLRDSLRGERKAAGSLAARYDGGQKTGLTARMGWSEQERRLNRAIRKDAGCTMTGSCDSVTGESFRQYDRKIAALLDGVGTAGNGVRVEKGIGAHTKGGGIASAPLNGDSMTIYGDFFGDESSDASRVGYVLHELGHAFLGLTDQISVAGLATLGITIGHADVNPPYNGNVAYYDVYSRTGMNAAIALGVLNHNDRFICSTGLRGC